MGGNMFSKKLLFALSIIFFIVSILGLTVFKVDDIEINISESGIQSRMEPIYYFKKTLNQSNVTYEIENPTVSVSKSGDVTVKSELTLTSGTDVQWGLVIFTAKVAIDNKNNAFYLEIPNTVTIKLPGKDSSKENFSVWNTDAKTLAKNMTPQLNAFLKKTAIETIKDGDLRNQASSLSIAKVSEGNGYIHLVLAVEQTISIVVVYTVMILSILIWLSAYFFVGGKVGFKDAENIGFRDPRRDPNND